MNKITFSGINHNVFYITSSRNVKQLKECVARGIEGQRLPINGEEHFLFDGLAMPQLTFSLPSSPLGLCPSSTEQFALFLPCMLLLFTITNNTSYQNKYIILLYQ